MVRAFFHITKYPLMGMTDYLETAAVAVLELLAAATGTRVVRARHLLGTVGRVVGLLRRLAGVVAGGSLLGLTCLLELTLGVEILLLLYILLAVFLLLCLLDLLGRLHLGDLAAHEDACRAVVHIVDHVVPELDALQLEDQQRIFLLIAGVLDRVAELVEQTEVLLPVVVDDVKEDDLLKLLDDRLALGVVGLP